MMTEDTRPLVQVVAGILLDQNGRYLLSSRPEGKPYAGYWEFAGGKVEAGEAIFKPCNANLKKNSASVSLPLRRG